MANRKTGKVARPGTRRSARHAAHQSSESGNPQLPAIVEETVAMDTGENLEKGLAEHTNLEADPSQKSAHASAEITHATTGDQDKDLSENDLPTEQVPVEMPPVDSDHLESHADMEDNLVQGTKTDETKELEEESDERTVTEALDVSSPGTEEEEGIESQSQAKEIPVPVSSDDSDCPLSVFQQKTKGRTTSKRKTNSVHTTDASEGPSMNLKRRVSKRKKGETSESNAPASQSGDPSIKPLSEKFLSVETKKRFEKFKGVEVIAERNVNVMDFRKNQVWELFVERQLTGTMTYACPFSKGLVREFYSNLTQRTDLPGDQMYHKAFVRGRFIEFSPTVINKLLGTPDDSDQGLADYPAGTTLEDLEVSLTGEFVDGRSGKIPVASLKFESRVMFLVGKTNWFPTRRTDVIQDELALLIFKFLRKEKVNLGSIIYSHILSRAEDMRVRYLLLHPCLIQSIIVRQSPEIIADSEITEVIQRPLIIESRVQRTQLSRVQLCSKTFALLMKHDKLLRQVEESNRKNAKVVAQIRAQQHALREEFQRGESGANESSSKDKGKGKVVEEIQSDAEEELEEANPDEAESE
ncbi:PREDICTED: uncharacterized protein LOC104804878 [Tarenaya hassleriana]|uniref:uncharacterized protein LOC104804878 n=1 Tax=Tarenaya hassleriana TaxID=28532 RepID=UPI00053C76BD|nr:PREDICTED: uncharacterized protein LOC104804878 [Tarenaya hassleriana]